MMDLCIHVYLYISVFNAKRSCEIAVDLMQILL